VRSSLINCVKISRVIPKRPDAAAAISRSTSGVGIVVSQTATVGVFKGGEIVAEILPE